MILSTLLSSLSLLSATPVTQVVVYPDRAQVTRKAVLSCGAEATALFDPVTPAADPATFRAHASEGVVDSLKAEVKTRADAFAPKRRTLETRALELERELEALRDQRAKADGADRVATRLGEVTVQLVSREMAEPKPDPKAWTQALDVPLAKRVQVAEKRVEIAAAERKVQEALEDVRRELGELSQAAARTEHHVQARVTCPAGKTVEVRLTYLVGGASWTPSYEARADEAAGTIELSTFATLRQATGEDWKGAKLLLSTAVPSENAAPPTLQPLRIYVHEQEEQQKVLVAREELYERADDLGGKDRPSAPPPGGAQAKQQGLSVQLEVPKPGDVPGDGVPTLLFIGKHELKGKAELQTVPKKLPFAFRIVEASNTAPFPLLPGMLSAFRKNGFVGRYPIERTAQGALLRLSFGMEESVRVKRVVVEEVKKEAGIFSGKHRFRYSYRFEVAHYGKAPVELHLAEQVPISELDDVTVEIETKKTTPGYQLLKEDGIARWKVALKPGDKRNVELHFFVDVPTSYETGS